MDLPGTASAAWPASVPANTCSRRPSAGCPSVHWPRLPRSLPREHRERGHEERERQDRAHDPPDYLDPAAPERAPAPALAREADGPHARAAVGEHAAVAAHRLATTRAWAHRGRAAMA